MRLIIRKRPSVTLIGYKFEKSLFRRPKSSSVNYKYTKYATWAAREIIFVQGNMFPMIG